MDPGLLARTESLDQAIGRMSAGSRFNGVLVGGFAAVAFLMVMIGVYGVRAFAVAQRTQEIGIRMALGAAPRHVQALILREGVLLLAAGTAAGLTASLLAARSSGAPSYEIQPTDLPTYTTIVAVI